MKKFLSIFTFACLLLASCAKEQATTTQDDSSKAETVTGTATHISCNNAEISGKANLFGKAPSGLSFGLEFSSSSGMPSDYVIRIEAKALDSDCNFTVSAGTLEPETTYYYRSYVIQNKVISYGDLKSFKTLPVSSMIQTSDATDVHLKNAVANAVLDLTDCKYEALEYGFELTPEGGLPHTVKSSNLSDKKFSVKDECLERDTDYSFVAYVTLDGRTYRGDEKSFSTSVELPEGAVDLGLSVFWHQCNLGASKPEEYGRHFAWGDVEGQTWDGEKWSGDGFSTHHTYEIDNKGHLKPEYDAAHVILGDSWRMPTKEEQRELIDYCTGSYEYDEVNEVYGKRFTSNKPGFEDKSIFFPLAGDGNGSALNGEGTYALCWTSTFYNEYHAWYVFFSWNDAYLFYYYRDRNLGFTVRPVSG